MKNTFDGLVSGTAKPPKRTIKHMAPATSHALAEMTPTAPAASVAGVRLKSAVERAEKARVTGAYTISAIRKAIDAGSQLAGHTVDGSDLAAAQLILLQKTAPAYLKLKPDGWRNFNPDDLHRVSSSEGRAYGTRAATEQLPLVDVLRLGEEIRRATQVVNA